MSPLKCRFQESPGPFESNAPARRLDEPQHQSPERALARSRFAHQSQCFPGKNIERHIVDGAHLAPAFELSAERGFASRINLGQIANFDQRHCFYSRFQNTERFCYPAAIMGTATSAANSPTNLQRVKCSCKNMRASSTVTAGTVKRLQRLHPAVPSGWRERTISCPVSPRSPSLFPSALRGRDVAEFSLHQDYHPGDEQASSSSERSDPERDPFPACRTHSRNPAKPIPASNASPMPAGGRYHRSV